MYSGKIFLSALFFMCLNMSMTSAMLRIMSPPELKDLFKDGLIKASYANFGYIPYGHTMHGSFFRNEVDMHCTASLEDQFSDFLQTIQS